MKKEKNLLIPQHALAIKPVKSIGLVSSDAPIGGAFNATDGLMLLRRAVTAEQREMQVATQTHEQLHALRSPTTQYSPGLTGDQLIQFLEDARIHRIGATKGLTDYLRPILDRHTNNARQALEATPWQQMDPMQQLAVLAETINSGQYGVLEPLPRLDRNTLFLLKVPAKLDEITRLLNMKTHKKAGMKKMYDLAIAVERLVGIGIPRNISANQRGEGIPIEKATLVKNPGVPEWMEMVIQHLPLVKPVRSALYSLTRRSTPEGLTIRNIDRLLTDQRVFSQSVRQEACTVLQDFSDSMSLNEADIERLLTKKPAAQVAYYCGKRGGAALAICCKEGRRAIAFPRIGGVNGCDGPALQWLGQQKGRKIWISDGQVNGIDTGLQHYQQCLDLVRQHDVERYETIAEFIANA